MGKRFSTPLSCRCRIAGVKGNPATETTDFGGKPSRTLSSTIATACLPFSWSNSYTLKSGSFLVTHVVFVISEISPNNCTAEIPPPTIITCFPVNSSAFLYSPVCNCLPVNVFQPGYFGQCGVFHVPVAFIIPLAEN